MTKNLGIYPAINEIGRARQANPSEAFVELKITHLVSTLLYVAGCAYDLCSCMSDDDEFNPRVCNAARLLGDEQIYERGVCSRVCVS